MHREGRSTSSEELREHPSRIRQGAKVSYIIDDRYELVKALGNLETTKVYLAQDL